MRPKYASMKDGKSTTAGFLSSMLGAVPPMNEMFKMVGMELPSYLGNEIRPEKVSEPAMKAEANVGHETTE